MTILTQLLSQTVELQKHVEQGLPADDDERMVFINQLDAWLVQRGQLIEQLVDHTTEPDEYDVRDELIKRNSIFQEKLLLLQHQIRRDLKQVQLKKETGRKYEQPYDGMTDGAFFDKRGI